MYVCGNKHQVFETACSKGAVAVSHMRCVLCRSELVVSALLVCAGSNECCICTARPPGLSSNSLPVCSAYMLCRILRCVVVS